MAFSLLARADRGLGSVAIAGLLLPALVAASVSGFALQRAVADDGPAAVELPANRYAVPVYDCPGDPTVADVHNGDRVFAIGVHEELDGWLLIRNPIEPSVQWWIENRFVATDSATGDLPDLGCDDPVPEPTGEVAAPAEATTTTEPENDEENEDDDESTTTTDPDEPTTTTEGNGPTTTRQQSSTTTTSPGSTTTKPPSTTTTTTTEAPDTSGPSLSMSQSHKDIWETYPSSCAGKAKQATISASASDPSGVKSVIATWSVGNFNESRDLTTGPKSFGPYNYGTVPSSGQPVTITVKALDSKNNPSTKTMSIAVHSTDECFG